MRATAGLASLADPGVWKRELTPTPERWRTALRVTIACTVAAGVAQALHLDQGFWSIVTILVLAPPTVAASLRKAGARLLGTAAGCLMALGAVSLFAQAPPVHLAVIVLLLAATLYFALGSVAPYSFFVAAFTFALVTYTSVQEPQTAGVIAAHRFTEISLGIVISAASHLLLWPSHADRALCEGVATKLERSVSWLDLVVRRAGGETPPPPSADPPPSERLSAQMTLLDTAAGLHEAIHRARLAWAGVVGLAEVLRLACTECARLALLPAAERGLVSLQPALERFVEDARREVAALASAIRRSQRPSQHSMASLAPLDARFDQLRHDGSMRDWRTGEISALAAVIESLRTIGTTLDRLGPMIAAAQGLEPQREALDIPPATTPSILPLDPERVRLALKASMAAAITIVIGSALHWPLGLPATATCVVLAMTTSLGSFVQKAGSRLLGALLGGATVFLILLWIMPWINSILALLLLTALGAFPCAWLIAGSDRVSYLGLQTMYAFAIALLGPLRPVVDLGTPTSRLLGVFLGIIVFGAVAVLIWPSYATQQYRRAIASTLRIMIDILRDAVGRRSSAPFVSSPRQRRLYDSIAACTRLLGEAEYEDPSERRLARSDALHLLLTVRRLARSSILWRQSRWSASPGIPPSRTTDALASLGAHCIERLASMAEAITAGRAPPPDATTDELIAALDSAIAHDRASRALASWPVESVDALFASVEHARAVAVDLGVLQEDAARVAWPTTGPMAYAPPSEQAAVHG